MGKFIFISFIVLFILLIASIGFAAAGDDKIGFEIKSLKLENKNLLEEPNTKPGRINLQINLIIEEDKNNLDKILNLVKEKGWDATVYVTAEFAGNNSVLVRQLYMAGTEIALLGDEDLETLSYKEQFSRINESKSFLESIINGDINHFRLRNSVVNYSNIRDTVQVMRDLNFKSITQHFWVDDTFTCPHSRSEGFVVQPMHCEQGKIVLVPIGYLNGSFLVDELIFQNATAQEFLSFLLEKYNETSKSKLPFTLVLNPSITKGERISAFKEFLDHVKETNGIIVNTEFMISIANQYMSSLSIVVKEPDVETVCPGEGLTLKVTFSTTTSCPSYFIKIYGRYESNPNWKELSSASNAYPTVTVGTYMREFGITIPEPQTEQEKNDKKYKIRAVGRGCWPNNCPTPAVDINSYERKADLDLDILKIITDKTIKGGLNYVDTANVKLKERVFRRDGDSVILEFDVEGKNADEKEEYVVDILRESKKVQRVKAEKIGAKKYRAAWDWKSSLWKEGKDIPVGKYEAEAKLIKKEKELCQNKTEFYTIFNAFKKDMPEYLADAADRKAFVYEDGHGGNVKDELGYYFIENEIKKADGKWDGRLISRRYSLIPYSEKVFYKAGAKDGAIKVVDGQKDPAEAVKLLTKHVDDAYVANTGALGGLDGTKLKVEKLLTKTEAQCADHANLVSAYVRSIGIASHPTGIDAAECDKRGSPTGFCIDWGFHTWTESWLGGKWKPTDSFTGRHEPQGRDVFGASGNAYIKKTNDLILYGKADFDNAELGDYGASSIVVEYDFNPDDDTLAARKKSVPEVPPLDVQKAWVEAKAISKDYWGVEFSDPRPGATPNKINLTITTDKDSYTIGDTITANITVISNEPMSLIVSVNITWVDVVEAETKAPGMSIVKNEVQEISIDPFGSISVESSFILPATTDTTDNFFIFVEATESSGANETAFGFFDVEPLFNATPILPDNVEEGTNQILTLNLKNLASTTITGINVTILVDEEMFDLVDENNKFIGDLLPGEEINLTWNGEVVGPSYGGISFLIESENGGNELISKYMKVLTLPIISVENELVVISEGEIAKEINVSVENLGDLDASNVMVNLTLPEGVMGTSWNMGNLGGHEIFTNEIIISFNRTSDFVISVFAIDEAGRNDTGFIVFEFNITRTDALFTGNFIDSGVDSDFDGKFEKLAVTAEVNVTKAGDYIVTGVLEHENASVIDIDTSELSLPVGIQNVVLNFDSMEIFGKGINGPYNVSLDIYDKEFETLDSAEIETGVYGYTQFFPGYTITGNVKAFDGELLEGVRVDLEGLVFDSVFTEQNGNYEFSGLERGSYAVVVISDEKNLKRDFSELFLTSDRVVDFVLDEAGSIEGVVRNESGSPLNNVTIFYTGFETPRWTTDENGTYLIPGLDANSYELHAEPPIGLEFLSDLREVDVFLGQTTTADFVLGKGGGIFGRVVGENGAPVSNTFVRTSPFFVSNYTDENGNYFISGLRGGAYNLSVDPAFDSPFIASSVQFDIGSSEIKNINVTLPIGGVLKGIIRDENGNLISGADISASGPLYKIGISVNGNYTIVGLDTGSYEVTVTPPFGLNLLKNVSQVNVSAGEVIVFDIVLPIGGVLTGVVKDENGTIVRDAYVSAFGPSYGAGYSDVSGRYEIIALETGMYTVSADPGFGRNLLPNSSMVDVVQGETKEFDIILLFGGILRGFVKDENGNLVSGASVSAIGPLFGADVTASDGSYEIIALRTGSYIVSTDPGFGENLLPDFTIIDILEDEITEFNASLKIGGRIKGAISVNPPIEDAYVSAFGPSYGADYSNANGNYEMIALRTGEYEVSTSPFGFSYETRTVNVVEGSDTIVDFVLTPTNGIITGVVMVDDTPVEGMGIQASDSSGFFAGYDITSSNGRFMIVGLQTDDYTVSTDDFFPGVTNDSAVVSINGPEIKEVNFSLALTAGMIYGSIRDELGEPVEGFVSVDFVWFDSSNEEGNYMIFGIPEGSYSVVAAPGFGENLLPNSQEVTIGIEKKEVNFILEKGGILKGRVTDTSGSPIPGVGVSVSSGFASTDLSGDYEIVGLATGAYDVIFDPGFGSGFFAETRTISIIQGETTEFDITLIKPGILEATLLEPVANSSFNILRDADFNVTANVKCKGDLCGNVTAILDPEIGRYSVSNIEADFTDISLTGNNVALFDDDSELVDIGFNFTFYDKSYDSVFISSNGFLTFEAEGSTSFGNVVIPSSFAPDNFIAPFWDDLNPGIGGFILFETRGVAPNRVFIVQWDGVPPFGGLDGYRFQVKLHESGEIEIQYFDVISGTFGDSGASATVGVEKDGTEGTQFSFDDGVLTEGGLLFEPVIVKGMVPVGAGEPFYTIDENPTMTGCLKEMVDDSSCNVSWQVKATGEGSWEFFVIFESSILEVLEIETQHVNVSIESANMPPVLEQIGNQQVNENETLIIDVNASDPENNLVYYTDAALVISAFSFDSLTGLFAWTPGFNDSGNYSVTFNVSDGFSFDQETIIIEVIDVPIVLCDGADTNKDGLVDANDLAAIRTNFGQNCIGPGWCNGSDTNKDTIVDANDLASVRRNFGRDDCLNNELLSSNSFSAELPKEESDNIILTNVDNELKLEEVGSNYSNDNDGSFSSGVSDNDSNALLTNFLDNISQDNGSGKIILNKPKLSGKECKAECKQEYNEEKRICKELGGKDKKNERKKCLKEAKEERKRCLEAC